MIPFVALAVLAALDVKGYGAAAAEALRIYAALILSFLGGICWGHALKQTQGYPFVLSMVPFFAAWLALSVPLLAAYALLLAAFAIAYLIDRRAAAEGLVADWFMSLRRILTAVVMLSLLLALLAG